MWYGWTVYYHVQNNMVTYQFQPTGSTIPSGTISSEKLPKELIPGDVGSDGTIIVGKYAESKVYTATVSDGKLIGWKLIAGDAEVVHTTGNEAIAGDKSFTGNVNVSHVDNHFTGTATFDKPIVGALATRAATFTDFAVVAKNMITYAGNWYVKGNHIANDPIGGIMDWYNVLLANNILFTANASKDYIDSVQQAVNEANARITGLNDNIKAQQLAYTTLKTAVENLAGQINSKQVSMLLTAKDSAGKVKQILGVQDMISATGGLFSMLIPGEMYQSAGDVEEAYISVQDGAGTVISSIPVTFTVVERN
ncbi:hypothetical protein H7R52_07055 [Weissella confusa]|uniref:BppU N-terminal domain-containing protein n=1 Tax=Weissella confusa TaxID=1583 RepID=A0A923NDG8_WEICO|nr:hypothetical protein [Weissella confusa]